MTKRRQGPLFWLGVGVASVGTVALVIFAVLGATSDQGGSLAFAVTAPILIVAFVIGGYGLQNWRRLSIAETAFPSAVVIPLVVAPVLADQLQKLMTALGLPRSRVRPTTYSTLVVDGHEVLFITGRDAANPAASFPTEWVRSIRLGSTLVGLRMMTSIDITVVTSDYTASLPVIPMRNRGNWLRAVPDPEVATLAESLRLAMGLPG